MFVCVLGGVLWEVLTGFVPIIIVFQAFLGSVICLSGKLVKSSGYNSDSVVTQDWAGQNGTQIVTEMCGFITILGGTFLLHKTKDMAADSMIVFFYSQYPSVLY